MNLHGDPSATRILNRYFAGDEGLREELGLLVFEELRRIARAALPGPAASAALQPTELVHEAWIRLAGRPASFENRRRFFGFATSVMRSVLVDQARARGAQKRAGEHESVTRLDEGGIEPDEELDFLDLHAALERLEALDQDLRQLVELRFFVGLTHAEIAEVLGISLSTVERRWRLARAWLRGELGRALA